MKILVIGARRGIGKVLCELAIEHRHEVTALVRDAAGMADIRSQAHIIEGDILDAGKVSQAVEGQDVVCTAIGIGPTRRPVSVFSEGIKHTIAAMKRHGVERLIAVTGIGAGDSVGHGGFLYDRIFNPLLLSTIYADKNREEQLIRESGLRWTIVRPGFLTNGPLKGSYRATDRLEGVRCGKISRADVAHFILGEAASGEWEGKTPLLTY